MENTKNPALFFIRSKINPNKGDENETKKGMENNLPAVIPSIL